MILDQIVAYKKEEIEAKRAAVDLEFLIENCPARKPRPFSPKLRKSGQVALIAEVKKASPSKGIIRADFDPIKTGLIYTVAGASAISVLTDEKFFQGSSEYLKDIKIITELPVLRKDFIIDIYQIYESRVLGADAILLIMSILNDRQVAEFRQMAYELGMECLVEVHNETELNRAMAAGAKLIGINNRDLQTFKTDINTTLRLRQMIHDDTLTIVSESGINTREDVLLLQRHGVHAMLVGEALMREPDIRAKVNSLLGK